MSSLTIQKLSSEVGNLNANDRDLLLQSFAERSYVNNPRLPKKENFIDELICCGEIVRELIYDRQHYYLVRCDAAVESSDRIKLSPREKAIAKAIAEGYSSKEISKNLNISFWTVNTYLKRIFIKLDVNTRAAAIAKLMEDRLLDDESINNGGSYLLLVKTITDRN